MPRLSAWAPLVEPQVWLPEWPNVCAFTTAWCKMRWLLWPLTLWPLVADPSAARIAIALVGALAMVHSLALAVLHWTVFIWRSTDANTPRSAHPYRSTWRPS